MAIEKMSYITIAGPHTRMNTIMERCYNSEIFHLVSDKASGMYKNPTRNENNPYSQPLENLIRLSEGLKIDLKEQKCADIDNVNAEEIGNYIADLKARYTELVEQKEKYTEALSQHDDVRKQIEHLAGLEIDFEKIFQCKLISVRFGRIPVDSELKLEYYTNRDFIYISFDSDADYSWGVYFTSRAKRHTTDKIFESLYFERTEIPEYLHGNAQESLQILDNLLTEGNEKLAKINEELKLLADENSLKICSAYSHIRRLAVSYETAKVTTTIGSTFYISGFVPRKYVKQFIESFDDFEDTAVTEQEYDAVEMGEQPPVLLKNNTLFKPFETFVRMYGLPSYDAMDPTAYFAMSYIILFGIMFGDVGQGLLISLLGFILQRMKKIELAPIMIRIGFSSAFFGIIYGSVFGIETIITPFFHHEDVYRFLGYTEPPKNIFEIANYLLIAALFIGVVLILFSMLLNIHLSIKRRNYGEAFFGVNGIAGFVFYASLIVLVGLEIGLGIPVASPAYIIGLIALPVVIIFLRHPLTVLITRQPASHGATKVSIGSFIGENLIELFESGLTYLSNTMSFLRVGGFILSHAGMMLVVAQFGGMHGDNPQFTFGTVIAYVIGNLIVTGIEGFLVGIQVLRLEFYEIFSRFYSTGGKEFIPLGNDFEI